MDLDRYLTSLVGSWEALAAPHPTAAVRRGAGYVAMLHPDPVLNNALLLDPAALGEAVASYAGSDQYAVWSAAGDEAATETLAAAGLRRDVTTRPMILRLDDVAELPRRSAVTVDVDVDPVGVADLNGVSHALLAGVPEVRAYAVAGSSGLVSIPVGDDVNISFVATMPTARRRGLATAVMTVALQDARERGFRTASLQATPMAEPMYAALGFTPVGRWQEWVPHRDHR